MQFNLFWIWTFKLQIVIFFYLNGFFLQVKKDYINNNRESLTVQGVPRRISKVYSQTIVIKENKNKLVESHTNKKTRPPNMKV